MGSIVGGIASGVGSIIAGGQASGSQSSAARAQLAAIGPAQAKEQAGLDTATSFESPYAQAGASILPNASIVGNETYGGINQQLTGAVAAYNQGAPQLSPTTQYEMDQMTPLFNQQMAQRGLYNSGSAVAGLSNMYANLGAQNYQQAFTNLNTANQTGLSATNPLLSAGSSNAQTLGNQAVNTGQNQANTMTGSVANSAGNMSNEGYYNAQGTIGSSNAIAGMFTGMGQNSGYGNMGLSSAGSNQLQGAANSMAGDIMFAEGGRPEPGRPAIVGEKGPEVFVPDQPGTIVPNQQTGLSNAGVRPPGSGLSGPTQIWDQKSADELMKSRSEKAFHDEIIKQHRSMGMVSPYSDNIQYHLDRSAELAGVTEYHKAKGEAQAQKQKGLSSKGGK